MTIRYGANGMPMPAKNENKKPEALQEILEVNPNETNIVDEWVDMIAETEEEEENEDL